MPENEKINGRSLPAFSLAWELGYTIAVPLVGLALLGRFLDKKLGTSPFLLLTGLLLSLIITGIGVARKTMKVMKKMEGAAKNKACPEPSQREQKTINNDKIYS